LIGIIYLAKLQHNHKPIITFLLCDARVKIEKRETATDISRNNNMHCQLQ